MTLAPHGSAADAVHVLVPSMHITAINPNFWPNTPLHARVYQTCPLFSLAALAPKWCSTHLSILVVCVGLILSDVCQMCPYFVQCSRGCRCF